MKGAHKAQKTIRCGVREGAEVLGVGTQDTRCRYTGYLGYYTGYQGSYMVGMEVLGVGTY